MTSTSHLSQHPPNQRCRQHQHHPCPATTTAFFFSLRRGGVLSRPASPAPGRRLRAAPGRTVPTLTPSAATAATSGTTHGPTVVGLASPTPPVRPRAAAGRRARPSGPAPPCGTWRQQPGAQHERHPDHHSQNWPPPLYAPSLKAKSTAPGGDRDPTRTPDIARTAARSCAGSTPPGHTPLSLTPTHSDVSFLSSFLPPSVRVCASLLDVPR